MSSSDEPVGDTGASPEHDEPEPAENVVHAIRRRRAPIGVPTVFLIISHVAGLWTSLHGTIEPPYEHAGVLFGIAVGSWSFTSIDEAKASTEYEFYKHASRTTRGNVRGLSCSAIPNEES